MLVILSIYSIEIELKKSHSESISAHKVNRDNSFIKDTLNFKLIFKVLYASKIFLGALTVSIRRIAVYLF